MSVRIETSLRGFDRAKRVLVRLSHLDMGVLLDSVGQMIENQTRRRIDKQEGPPEGGSWDSYSEGYEKWKTGKGLIAGKGKGFLRLFGHLYDDIQHVVTGDQVAIGSGKVYAAAQQATRPYLGLSSENQDDVEDLISRWIAKQVHS